MSDGTFGDADEALVAAFRAGDIGAFEAIYTRYVPAVRSFCYARLSPDEAADATQETFTRLMSALRSHNNPVCLERYVKRAARNVVIDYYRRRPPRRDELNHAVADTAVEQNDPVELTVERRLTAAAILSTLRPLDRSLLVEHHAEDLSLRDVAEMHSSTPGSVKVLLHRARANARAAAEAQGWRSLWPAPLLGWARRVLRRSGSGTGFVRVAAVVPILALMIVVAPPVAGGWTFPAFEADKSAGAKRPTARGPRQVEADPTRKKRSSPDPRASLSTAAPAKSAAEPRAEAPSRRPLLDLPITRVPGTNRALRSRPPPGQTFEYDYGVEVKSGSVKVRAGVAVDDERESQPVHEAACAGAEAAPAALQCTRQPKDE